MTSESAVSKIPPDILRLRAANPSPLTGSGTNCYLLRGGDGAVLIDAGPDMDCHIAATLAALNGTPLRAILITHPHLDHSAAALRLAAQTGARIYSFGPPARHAGAGQEGADFAHSPDVVLHDGAQISFGDIAIAALHTPGHMRGHLCFGYRDVLFSGDHVMGWATSLVGPPEGDMAAYRASLRKLQGLPFAQYLPGHGEPVDDPAARLDYLIQHRNEREAQILAALADGTASAETIAAKIYTDIPSALLPAAAKNVLAHLIELAALGRVIGPFSPMRSSVFALL
jgi:hydroxyacylglutathione hydrolase